MDWIFNFFFFFFWIWIWKKNLENNSGENQRRAYLNEKRQKEDELNAAMNAVEEEQRRLAQERTTEMKRRIAAQQQKIFAYEEKKKKVAAVMHCAGCDEPFFGGPYYNVFGELWHPGCFGCYECGVTFGDFGYYVREVQVPIKSRSLRGVGGGVGGGVGETKLKKRPFCRDHSEVTFIGKTLLWLGAL